MKANLEVGAKLVTAASNNDKNNIQPIIGLLSTLIYGASRAKAILIVSEKITVAPPNSRARILRSYTESIYSFPTSI